MKTNLAVLIAFAATMAFTTSIFAVEGLTLSVQSSNVVLEWPSDPNSGDTFIVQRRETLDTNSTWQTLTNFYPAASGTNMTVFVDSGAVCVPVGGNGSGGGGSGGPPVPGNNSSEQTSKKTSFPSLPPLPWDTNSYRSARSQSLSAENFSSEEDESGSGVCARFYRVARNGVHLYGLANGSVLSGEVTAPIEFAVDSADEVVGVTFYDENNSPILGASASTNAAGGWVLDWNTTLSSNGNYNVYVELNFASDDSVVSQPVTVTVTNTISFPNYFSRIFGEQMWIYAQTIPGASYTLDMSDQDTNYLGTFGGYADGDGVISFLWDLTDGNGNTFESTNFFGEFIVDTSSSNFRLAARTQIDRGATPSGFKGLVQKTSTQRASSQGVHPEADGSSANASQAWAKESNWTQDKFAVAYSPLNDNPTTTFKLGQTVIGGDNGIYGGAVSALSDQGFGYSLSPGNVYGTSAFQMHDAVTRAELLGYLSDHDYRNFYFNGHGNSSSFGTYNKFTISSRDIQNGLGNFLNSRIPFNYHPYRFVFLDTCESGKGKMCEAFGIPAQTVNNNFFALSKVRSRAFLGFKGCVGFSPAQWDFHSITLGILCGEWTAGARLDTCVHDAQQPAVRPLDSSAVIYGATDLQRSSP